MIKSTTTDQVYTIKTLGLLSPEELPIKSLHCGQIGMYFTTFDGTYIFYRERLSQLHTYLPT